MTRALPGFFAIATIMALPCSALAWQDADPNPLSGPTVREPGVPGNSTTFTGRGRREGERVIDHRTFLKGLESLRGEAVAVALRLTRDQEEQLFGIEREFRVATKAYFEKNLNDIRDVRDVLGIRGDLPAAESTIRKVQDELRKNIVGEELEAQAPLSEEALKEAAREKARRIYDSAPRATEVHARIWKLLTPPQRDALSETLDALVSQQEAQRRAFLSPGVMNGMAGSEMNPGNADGGMMNGVMGDAKMNTADGMKMGAQSRARADADRSQIASDPAALLGMDPGKIAADDPRLPERVRRRIRNMKPEARVEAIGRYLIDLKQELAEAKAMAAPDKSAAPTIDRVNIPTPEKK